MRDTCSWASARLVDSLRHFRINRRFFPPGKELQIAFGGRDFGAG